MNANKFIPKSSFKRALYYISNSKFICILITYNPGARFFFGTGSTRSFKKTSFLIS